MDIQVLTTVITGAMLAMFTAILAWQGKGRFDGLDRQATALRSEMAELRSEMTVLRSDLTHVALAVGAQPRPQTG